MYVRSPPAVFGDSRAIRFAPHSAPFPLLAAHMRAAGLLPRASSAAKDAGCWDRAADMSYRARTAKAAAAASGTGAATSAASQGSVSLVPPAQFNYMVVPSAGGNAQSKAGGASKSQREGFSSSGEGDGAGEGKEDDVLADGGAKGGEGASGRLVRKRSLLSGGFVEEGNAIPLPEPYSEAMRARLKQVREVRRHIRDAGLSAEQQSTLQGAIQAHFREWLLSSGRLRQVSDLVRIFGGGSGGDDEAEEASSKSAVQAAMEEGQGHGLTVGQTTPLRLQAPPPGLGSGSQPQMDDDGIGGGSSQAGGGQAARADPGRRSGAGAPSGTAGGPPSE